MADEEKLQSLLLKLEEILRDNVNYLEKESSIIKELQDFNIDKKLINKVLEDSKGSIATVKNILAIKGKDFIIAAKKFLDSEYGSLFDLTKMLFLQIFYYHRSDFLRSIDMRDEKSVNVLGGNYLLMNLNYKTIRNIINKNFIKDFKQVDGLIVDEESPLWDMKEMEHKIYPSDFSKIRRYTKEILQDLSSRPIEELKLLSQQVSEIIKNAIRHGNKSDPNKIIKVWYQVTPDFFKIIVEDEGDGFKDIDIWNEFFKKRNKAFESKNMDEMMKYVTYRGPDSSEEDGGTSLFSAIEYWDSGMIYNSKKNKVVAIKYFY
jgi:hypothetical protein